MDDNTVMELIKTIAGQGTKLDVVTASLAKVEERMTKLEALREQDVKQNEKIEQILSRLQQGNAHFEKIDTRLSTLEQTEGKRAKDLVKQIKGIFVAAICGAVIGNIGGILHFLGGN